MNIVFKTIFFLKRTNGLVILIEDLLQKLVTDFS